MNKDFEGWNRKKQTLEKSKKHHLFKDGDIWWMSVGINVGQESCGKGDEYRRPVLVLRKLSGESFIGIPLSTQKKTGSWFAEFDLHGEIRYALLYQIRMFSANRLQRRIGTLSRNELFQIKEKLKELLEL